MNLALRSVNLLADLGFNDITLSTRSLRFLQAGGPSSSPFPLAPIPLMNSANIAADLLQYSSLPLDASPSPIAPCSPTHFPMIHARLLDGQRGRQPHPLQEPLTSALLLATYSFMQALHHQDQTSYLGMHVAVFDCISCLGPFTGSCISQYA